MVCSVIIATRNRAPDLQKTLRCLEQVSVPDGWDGELIIADNASTDETAAVARAAKLKKFEVRYLYEGRKGKGYALNAALVQARGEIILFTDDDVVPAPDWLERLGAPLLERKHACVVGRIDLASDLRRPWMNATHLSWLAASNEPYNGKWELIGANSGFHRSVLGIVPSFDPELGPGGLGFAEDTLFSWQLNKAGIEVRDALEAKVVHHLAPSRILRAGWLSAARSRGRCLAYLLHHWQHGEIKWPRLRMLNFALKLSLRRATQATPSLNQEGAPLWELGYVVGLERCKQFLIEKKRPRHYSQFGLRRTETV